MKTSMKLTLAAAALAAAMGGYVPAGHAFGDAPWCAVIDSGTGDVHWDCQYNSVAACAPNVVAGNRGFCNLNPYWRGGPAPRAVVRTAHRHHHGRHWRG